MRRGLNYIANHPSLVRLQPGDVVHGVHHDFVVRQIEVVPSVWRDGVLVNMAPPPILHLLSMAGGRARRVKIPGDRFLRTHVPYHRAYYTRPGSA